MHRGKIGPTLLRSLEKSANSVVTHISSFRLCVFSLSQETSLESLVVLTLRCYFSGNIYELLEASFKFRISVNCTGHSSLCGIRRAPQFSVWLVRADSSSQVPASCEVALCDPSRTAWAREKSEAECQHGRIGRSLNSATICRASRHLLPWWFECRDDREASARLTS